MDWVADRLPEAAARGSRAYETEVAAERKKTFGKR